MWFIVDVAEADQWTKHWHGGRLVPERRRPTIAQPTREIAETEALRLAREHPGRRFIVLEPVAVAFTTKVTTHVTLGGQVVAERSSPALAQITDPHDEVPF